MFLSEDLQKKWEPILGYTDLPKIEDNYKKVTTFILENQEKVLLKIR